jgi:hypothetical protein
VARRKDERIGKRKKIKVEKFFPEKKGNWLEIIRTPFG